LGLTVTGPLDAKPQAAVDNWVVQVPRADADAVLAALFAAGAGGSGDYRDCALRMSAIGQFRPMGQADSDGRFDRDIASGRGGSPQVHRPGDGADRRWT